MLESKRDLPPSLGSTAGLGEEFRSLSALILVVAWHWMGAVQLGRHLGGRQGDRSLCLPVQGLALTLSDLVLLPGASPTAGGLQGGPLFHTLAESPAIPRPKPEVEGAGQSQAQYPPPPPAAEQALTQWLLWPCQARPATCVAVCGARSLQRVYLQSRACVQGLHWGDLSSLAWVLEMQRLPRPVGSAWPGDPTSDSVLPVSPGVHWPRSGLHLERLKVP